MKRINVLVCVSAIFLIVMSLGIFLSADNQQTAKELYEAAVFKKDADGDMLSAIKLFEKILEQYPKEQNIAAMAQLQIGICYEKLGQKSIKLAQDAFQKVINNYPLQSEVVKTAQEKLSLLSKAQALVEEGDKELRVRKISSVPETGMGEISPDGRYLSLVDWGTGNLAILETATGQTRNLTKGGWTGYPQTSRWSPDSKQIVYQWIAEPDIRELRIVGIDGSEPRTFYRFKKGEWIEPADWSPDGKYILTKSYRKEDTCELELMSFLDGSVRIIKTIKYFTPSLGIKAQFSPNGRYIAYDFPKEGNPPEFDIFMMSIDGSHEIPLSTHPSLDNLLGWAPDGERIIFISKRTGTLDLWSIRVAEGEPQGTPLLIKRNIGSIEPRGITQDGSFYYNTPRLMYDIYTATLDPEMGKIIKPPAKLALPYEGYNDSPSWSPDGKFLAYVSNRNRIYIFCIYSIETDKIRELSFKRNYGFPHWFPDGRSILVQATVGSGQGIHRIDTQTGNAAPVIERRDGEILSSAHVSPDGKLIFYSKENDSKKLFQILVRDIKTGKERELLRTPPFDNNTIALSPDGKRLAILMREEENVRILKVMPATGGQQTEVHRFKQGGRWIIDIAWSPDGQYIFFYKSAPDGTWELWRISSEGGKAQDLGLRMGLYMHLNIHPDGKQITFASYPKESLSQELWVMENFLPLDELPQKDEKEDFVIRKMLAGGAPSHDGKYLSYRDKETGDLAIREIGTGKTQRLTNKGSMEQPREFVTGSAISPDSKLVAYTWTNQYRTYDLCLIGIDGSGDRILYSGKYNQLELDSWSSDGKQIVFRRYPAKNNQNLEIILVSVVDGTTQVLKTFEKPFGPRIRYSPDDRFIAYDFPSAAKSGNYDINLLAIDGSGEIHLIEHPANDRLLGWIPNREEMLFLSNRAGTYDIWAINVENGKEKSMPFPVKRDIGQISPKGFTRDGSFYYSIYTRRFTTEIAPFDLKTGKVQEELSSPLFVGSNFTVEWSPDGENLVYKTEKTDPAGPGFYNRPLYVRNLKTGEERELAGEFEVNEPRWSPDGRSVLVIGYSKAKENQRANTEGIYKIDVQNNQVTQIVQLPPDHRSIAEWSLDGKAVFYKNRDRILMRDLESGREKQIYQNINLAEFLDLSSDGKRLVLVTRNPDEETWSMLIMSVSGGEPKELCKLQGSNVLWSSDVTWTPDGNYVLFAKYDEKKGSSVWRITAEGGEPDMIWESRDLDGFVVSLSVHPQGSTIAISFLIQESEFWVMENFLSKTEDKK